MAKRTKLRKATVDVGDIPVKVRGLVLDERLVSGVSIRTDASGEPLEVVVDLATSVTFSGREAKKVAELHKRWARGGDS